MPDFTRRFERQTRFAPLGKQGQARLCDSRVLLVGCGALGGALAQSLVRSGVGELVLVDRDLVEESNLPRQVLFEERHARESTPKVQAAAETLARIGGPTALELHATHLDESNAEELSEDCDLVLDGTDNLATRYLLNDLAVQSSTPWIYGGVVGSGGLVLAVLPGKGPCLRCLFPEPAPQGSLETCETAGVLQPAVALVAALQAGLALRLLAGPPLEKTQLFELDAWEPRTRALTIERDPNCPCCSKRDFPFLNDAQPHRAVRLCGRNTVQVRGARGETDLAGLERSLAGVARSLQRNELLLRFEVDEGRITVFPDGRALVEGTEDVGRALALYDRYLGR
ncbi:MAG: ThiF family adenylyltransferase [Planctomycetes bacterium]|nr:ThiF family adenylyltransferase [Planctomycetota bacterium]